VRKERQTIARDVDSNDLQPATLERGLAMYHSLAAAVDAVAAEGGFLRMPSIGDIR